MPLTGKRSGGKAGDDQQRELAEYQQKLSEANNGGQPQAQARGGQSVNLFGSAHDFVTSSRSGAPRMGLAGSYGSSPVAPSTTSPAAAQPAAPTAGGGYFEVLDSSKSMASVAAPTAPAGLTSLDFELPTDTNLYELYRFTTPRGEAELTARTISNSTLGQAGTAGGHRGSVPADLGSLLADSPRGPGLVPSSPGGRVAGRGRTGSIVQRPAALCRPDRHADRHRPADRALLAAGDNGVERSVGVGRSDVHTVASGVGTGTIPAQQRGR